MAVQLPDGSLVSLATDYSEAFDVTAVTNAKKAVLTLETGHGLDDGDAFELISGWSGVTNRVFRAESVAGDEITIKADTSDIQRFKAGSGTGSVRKILQMQQIQQILSFEGQGGEPQYATYEFLDSDVENQIPTKFSAQSINISIADDEKQPGYQAFLAASETRSVRALEVLLPNGSTLYYNGYPSMNPTPTMTKGQVMAISASYSVLGRVVRY